jgi:hypothetical protein
MGTLCFSLSLMYVPVLLFKARKFALLFTLGSLFFVLRYDATDDRSTDDRANDDTDHFQLLFLVGPPGLLETHVLAREAPPDGLIRGHTDRDALLRATPPKHPFYSSVRGGTDRLPLVDRDSQHSRRHQRTVILFQDVLQIRRQHATDLVFFLRLFYLYKDCKLNVP